MNKSHSRTPSDSTILTEKTTKSNKSWKLPRMGSDGKLRAKLTRMTSRRKKATIDDVPAVPALPRSVYQSEKFKNTQESSISSSQIDTGSSSRTAGMSVARLESDIKDDPILKPPTPAFLGNNKRRNSSRSSLTSNSESGSEFGSERSFSAYSTSTAHSPLYINSSISSQNGMKASIHAEKAAKSSIANTIKTFGHRMKGREVQKSALTPLGSMMPSASASAPNLSRNEYTIEQDPFRSAPFYVPSSFPDVEKGSMLKSLSNDIKSSTSVKVQNKEKETVYTSANQKSTHKDSVHFTNPYFFKSKKVIYQNTSAISSPQLFRASESDDEYGEEEKLKATTFQQKVTNISPRQSPMVSPATLLPPTPPLSPLRSSGGLFTSGRKALYTCTMQKLHPQLRNRKRLLSSVTLKSPRSVNFFNDVQMHPSTTSHIRNLPILLARTQITRRLRNSTLTKKEEDEIQTFVNKGYLNIYLSPKEVEVRITQKSNNNAQAEIFTKPLLLSPSSEKTLNENGMAKWIQRKAFIERMKVISSAQNDGDDEDDEFKITTSSIKCDSFRCLHFSPRCKILAFGNDLDQSNEEIKSTKHTRKQNDYMVNKNDYFKGDLSNSLNKTYQSLPDKDDVPLALLKKQRFKSATYQNDLFVQTNDQYQSLQKDKILISEARHRRQQSDRSHVSIFTNSSQTFKGKNYDSIIQSSNTPNESKKVIPSIIDANPLQQKIKTKPENDRHFSTQFKNQSGIISRRTSMSMPAPQNVAMITPQPILVGQWTNPIHVPMLYGHIAQPIPMQPILYPMPLSTVQMGLSVSNSNSYSDFHREAQRFNGRSMPKRSPLSQTVYNA